MTDSLRRSVASDKYLSQNITQNITQNTAQGSAEAEQVEPIMALSQSQDFDQQILESSDDCIKVLDLEGRILFMSPRGQALLSIQDITPFLNTSWTEFWQGSTQAVAIEAIVKARAGKVCTFQGFRPTLSGEPKWWDNKISPIRGASGQVERLLCISRDISDRVRAEDERQQAEKALRESESKYRSLFESIDEGFCLIEVLFDEIGKADDYCFLEANPLFEKHTGLVDAIGKTMRELVPEHDAYWLEIYGKIALTGVAVRFENSAEALGRFFDIYAFRVGEPHERKVAVLFNDISERKRAEEVSRRAAEFDAFRVALTDTLRPLADPVEIQATASRVLGEYLGANRVAYFEVCGADYVVERDYVNGADAIAGGYPIDSFGPKLLAAFRAGRTVSMPNVATDPNLSPAQRSAYAAIQIGAYIGIPLVKGDEFVAVLAVHMAGPRDWTPDEVALVEEVAERTWAAVDRARTEAALRDSENRFRMAIESAQLGTWDWDLITNQLIWDEGCKAMFGLPPEAESNIESFFAGLHPDDRERLEQVLQQVLNPASGGKYSVEYRTIGIQDGIERWITAKGQVYFDATDQPQRFIGTVLNITEQKHIEAEREHLLTREQAARVEADRANRLKDEFLAVLSHELRSPLNPILGWSRLLQNGKLDAARTQQALKTIERNAQLQSELIEDLLDVSRILQGKLNLEVSSINLIFIIRAAMETVRLAAEAKLIQIESSLEPDVGLVSGDSTRLQQVVWNLLSNAVKFTPNGGQVRIRLERLDSYAQITVSDTGQGIVPDFLRHVFDSFRQADATTTRKFGGLGLGLAIVRHLVELHGGTVGVESPGVGMGATFTVRLPLMPTQAIATQNRQSPESDYDLSEVQVLVVDDEPDSREFVAFVLKEAGATVLIATTAAEALTMLIRFRPNVLLSDIGMPDMNGYMLMQQVRALLPEQGGQVAAIALTAYAGDFNQQQALQAGFQQHVSKPIEPKKLIEVISRLIQAT
ncbi:ATP-binding protein [Trichocoleus sp. FACHB-262]|uniref:ATP-binding protein n=1 Tax=Trichocoleus sp. FACHB-262 TaxID=2692869 RepID=UPI0016855226|nr:ATP-binding protein [Trichocoleus sp. FACHB-262]MBD2120928.1 PAS domain S-box protein [Trichocoleus sp. FACHB-262]